MPVVRVTDDGEIKKRRFAKSTAIAGWAGITLGCALFFIHSAGLGILISLVSSAAISTVNLLDD